MKVSDKTHTHTHETHETPGNQTAADASDKKKKTHLWAAKEDERLLAAVKRFGCRNWIKIAEYVGHRTADQCCQRWYRALSPEIRKGVWSEKEDAQLIAFVDKYGAGAWKKIAEGIPGRTDIQCRSRWIKIARKARKAQQAQQQTTAESLAAVAAAPAKWPALSGPSAGLPEMQANQQPIQSAALSLPFYPQPHPHNQQQQQQQQPHPYFFSLLCMGLESPVTASSSSLSLSLSLSLSPPLASQLSPSSLDKDTRFPVSPVALTRDRRMEIASLLNPED